MLKNLHTYYSNNWLVNHSNLARLLPFNFISNGFRTRPLPVEFGITGYYDPGRLPHAGSQDTNLPCHEVLSPGRLLRLLVTCLSTNCVNYETSYTDTDTLLKIQATNVQESMTTDNTMTHCIPRKINKSYKLKMDRYLGICWVFLLFLEQCGRLRYRVDRCMKGNYRKHYTEVALYSDRHY